MSSPPEELAKDPPSGSDAQGDWLAEARTPDPQREIALFEAEAAADAKANPKRAARLLSEIAYIRERYQAATREAAKGYAQSLTIDPSFQANAWALRRIFAGRGFWENLVRLLDAEIRFSALPNASDRADLHVEKGRILEDRLGRDADAANSYRAALDAVSDHAGAMWSLLLMALRTDTPADVEAALGLLAARTGDAASRAVFAVEQARLQRGKILEGLDSDRALRAADTLFKALAGGAAAGPILTELDRLSLLVDRPELRLRVLDTFDSRLSRDALPSKPDPGLVVALYREKAKILLKRGGKDAALAVLERAVALAPQHSLVVLDYLDAADDAGRPDAIAAVVDAHIGKLSLEAGQEALLRRAEVAARGGALGEAIGALERIAPESRLAPLVYLTRVRVLSRLGDAEGLAKAFVSEAARLVAAPETSNTVQGNRQEAAHLLVRAGHLRHHVQKDFASAQALFRQALSLVPEFRPAAEGLFAVLADTGQWWALAAFLEDELLTLTADPSRSQALREALVPLYRDILATPHKAVPHQEHLTAEPGQARNRARLVDLEGFEGQGATATAADPARNGVPAALIQLTDDVAAPTVRAALRYCATRFPGRTLDAATVEDLLRKAFAEDPSSTAGAACERLLAGEDRRDERIQLLKEEIRAADERGRVDVARALRYRLADVFAAAAQWPQAVAALEPLRKQAEALALAWSMDLARRSGQPVLELQLLRQTAAAARSKPSGGAAEAVNDDQLALAEATELTGQPGAAASAFAEARLLAPEGDGAIDALLGSWRAQTLTADIPGQVATLRLLASACTDAASAALVSREAYLLSLVADIDSGVSEAPTEAADVIGQWLSAVRAGDQPGTVAAWVAMAEAGVTEMWAAIGMRRHFLGLPEGDVALLRGTEAGAGQEALVGATDLPLTDFAATRVSELRRARAHRLAEDPGGLCLAEDLLADEAAAAEDAGFLQKAAQLWAEVLGVSPESLTATEGLRRVAEAAGDRNAEAQARSRLGTLLRDPRRAAEMYAGAALLFEDLGQPQVAAGLYLKVLERMPGDEEAYFRLHRILSTAQDFVGLERLVSYKVQRTVAPGLRVGLYVERATLRQERLGRVHDASMDWKRALAIDARHPEALRALGFLASAERRLAMAADLFERAIVVTSDADSLGQVRLALAATYRDAGNGDRALAVLTAAVQAQPEAATPRERLVALCEERRDLGAAREHLEILAKLAQDPVLGAAIQVRIGRMQRDQRQDLPGALTAFRLALQLDPMGDAAGELSRLPPEIVTESTADKAAIDQVIAQFRQVLADVDPFDVPRLERLRTLCRLRGAVDLAEVAAQILSVLGVSTDRVRTRLLQRPLSAATLATLGNPVLFGSDEAIGAAPKFPGDVWALIAESVARADGQDPSAHGATRHTNVAPGTEPRLQWLESAAAALGIDGLTVHLCGHDDLAVIALQIAQPTLILGRGILAGDSQARFRVGRALGLLRQSAADVERQSMQGLLDIFCGAALLAGAKSVVTADGIKDPGLGSDPIKARAKALAKHLSRKSGKGLGELAQAFATGALDISGWRAGVVRSANCVGLVVSADLAAALRVLTGQAGGDLQALGQTEPRDLVRFALHSRYGALRQQAAGAGEP